MDVNDTNKKKQASSKHHPRKVTLSSSLASLLQNKKIEKKNEDEEVEIALNDFDLDANEIFSWLRGSSDTISSLSKKESNVTPQKKVTSHSNRKQYTIEINKESTLPPPKQNCDNCYEKLPFIQIESTSCKPLQQFPIELKKQLIKGSFEGKHEGKTILYICNNYYVDYNFTLQSAIYLASSFHIPLILIIIRPLEEYSYPFTSHTIHLLHNLLSFKNQLDSLFITPLLLFTSSLSYIITHFIQQTYPLFILTEPFPDIRYELEFSFIFKSNSNYQSKLLLFSNHPIFPPSIFPPNTIIPSYDILKQLSSFIHSNLIHTLKIPSYTLQPSIQLKIAYSLLSNDSLYTACDDTLTVESTSFNNCILILPPFITEKYTIKQQVSKDFCYGMDQNQLQIANWGDIEHEIAFFNKNPLLNHSIESLFCLQKWYSPYYQESATSQSLYHIAYHLHSQYINEYSIYTACQQYADSSNELEEIISIQYYFSSFFSKHLNAIVISDPVFLIKPDLIHILEEMILQYNKQNHWNNLIKAIQTIFQIEGQLPFSLLLLYIQYLLLTLYKFDFSNHYHFSLLPILNEMKQYAIASMFNNVFLGEILRCVIIIINHYQTTKSLFSVTDCMEKITDYSKFLKGVAELEKDCTIKE